MSGRGVARCVVYRCGRWERRFQLTTARRWRAAVCSCLESWAGGRDDCARRFTASLICILEERCAIQVALRNLLPTRGDRRSTESPVRDLCGMALGAAAVPKQGST
jgi:hypothetical protein